MDPITDPPRPRFLWRPIVVLTMVAPAAMAAPLVVPMALGAVFGMAGGAAAYLLFHTMVGVLVAYLLAAVPAFLTGVTVSALGAWTARSSLAITLICAEAAFALAFGLIALALRIGEPTGIRTDSFGAGLPFASLVVLAVLGGIGVGWRRARRELELPQAGDASPPSDLLWLAVLSGAAGLTALLAGLARLGT